MTRSAGTRGLMRVTSPPSLATASRIAARSTTAGTPVKSCSTTRPGRKGSSMPGPSPVGRGSQRASVFDDLGVDELASRVSQRVLQQDAHREGQRVEVGEPLLLERLEAVIRDRLAEGGRQCRPRAKRVGRHRKWCGVHRLPVLLRNPGNVRRGVSMQNHAQTGCTRQFLPGARTMGKFRRRRPTSSRPSIRISAAMSWTSPRGVPGTARPVGVMGAS